MKNKREEWVVVYPILMIIMGFIATYTFMDGVFR